jgi:hypothetical protein
MSVNTVDIRDYLLDLNPGTINKAQSAADAFEVILQNNTDFIISRAMAKSARELVILISQGLFYFRDKKSGIVEDVTLDKLKAFIKGLGEENIKLSEVLWLPALGKDTIERLVNIISDEDIAEMCKHNVLAGIKRPEWYKKYWKQNQKLFIKLHSIFPTIADNATNKYRSSLPVIFEIDKRFGYNEAMYFAETLLRTGVERYTSDIERQRYVYNNAYGDYEDNLDLKGFMQLLDEPYNLSLRRLIEYVFYDAYAQGIANIDNTFWKTYEDYLSMQIKIHGKIKEKYPKYLKTEHDVLALKINMMEVVAKCEDFAERSGEVKRLEHNGSIYSIVVPGTPQQIADEGINLSHCVGSYVDKIINGDCHILFLRKSHAPEESLVTLQLSSGRINQAEGLHRRKITAEERKFLLGWGKAKDVEIAA